ncbi:MAG: transporter substrate-binding domain-containing protein [Pseudomonas sp.]|uniref:substrate-binding periplasmic protein n=1 Tax=Pseudomonas sp. TaxID=306 RepID=UPI0033909BB9
MRPLAWLLCAAISLFSPLGASEVVRLTNGEWPPYLGQKLPHQGVASRIVAEAFALEGVQVQWEFYPWARALRLAERGQSAGSAVWLRNAEREAAFFLSDPVLESGYYLFHRKDRPFTWQHIDDLKGLRIGAAVDYDYGEAFQQAEASGNLQVQRLSNENQGLHMLLAGRIDLFPISKEVAADIFFHEFSSAERAQLGFHPTPLRLDPMHLLLSRQVAGNADLMRRFNRGLTRLRQSGKIDQYLRELQQPPLSPP